MVEMWMPVTANVLLILMGLVFTVGGANGFSRFIGVICIVIAVLSLLANIGVIK
jgi:hypothetical protein